MIDMENSLGGGIPKALEIMQKWFTKYNLAHWVIEENGFQRAIRQDKSIREFAATIIFSSSLPITIIL